MTYPVNEIFTSLQGEGYWTGTPALFIRFSGCNLRCPFCDTDFTSATTMTVGEIEAEIAGSDAPIVVLTGGEPSLRDLEPVITAAHRHGKRVHVETNGTGEIPASADWVTLSPKEGGEVAPGRWDELKIVFADSGSDPMSEHAALIAETAPMHLFLQPCSGKNTAETISYILAHPCFRLSLQTHKLLDIR